MLGWQIMTEPSRGPKRAQTLRPTPEPLAAASCGLTPAGRMAAKYVWQYVAYAVYLVYIVYLARYGVEVPGLPGHDRQQFTGMSDSTYLGT